jgi:hypothetical protein
MQMEAETADMIDRRMMQLFAVAHKKFDKADVQNSSLNLAAARGGDANSPFGEKLTSMIELEGIPELGLAPSTKGMRSSVATLPALHQKVSSVDAFNDVEVASTNGSTFNNESLRREFSIA